MSEKTENENAKKEIDDKSVNEKETEEKELSLLEALAKKESQVKGEIPVELLKKRKAKVKRRRKKISPFQVLKIALLIWLIVMAGLTFTAYSLENQVTTQLNSANITLIDGFNKLLSGNLTSAESSFLSAYSKYKAVEATISNLNLLVRVNPVLQISFMLNPQITYELDFRRALVRAGIIMSISGNISISALISCKHAFGSLIDKNISSAIHYFSLSNTTLITTLTYFDIARNTIQEIDPISLTKEDSDIYITVVNFIHNMTLFFEDWDRLAQINIQFSQGLSYILDGLSYLQNEKFDQAKSVIQNANDLLIKANSSFWNNPPTYLNDFWHIMLAAITYLIVSIHTIQDGANNFQAEPYYTLAMNNVSLAMQELALAYSLFE